MRPQVMWLGQVDYLPTWHRMQNFTAVRDEHTADQVWYLEHPPVFTLGMNGKSEHVLAAGDIPVIPIDRGGQVTYHGPGQLVVYPLLDLRRYHLGVRQLVMTLEHAVIDTVAQWGIVAEARRDAPGVYVEGKKLASIGLRVTRGCCYHGLAMNVDMDISPFERINPCGYSGLQVIDLARLGVKHTVNHVGEHVVGHLLSALAKVNQSATNTLSQEVSS